MTASSSWQPSASLEALTERASMLQKIRQFFFDRQVLEVETPLLSKAIGTDPHLEPIKTQESQRFLQTSPEFAMKRLLASGSGDIYQICKACRSGDLGKNHNPEFSLLEWYRLGITLDTLMDEVVELVKIFLPECEPVKLGYREAFEQTLGIDPFMVSIQELKALSLSKINISDDNDYRDFWLDLLFTHLIEPELPEYCLLYNYPPSQAALSKIENDKQGIPVARRFELIIKGLEIANGYDELTNVGELQFRFEQDQFTRGRLGLGINPCDENFLQALKHGLPECCGVALGLDRLLMLHLGFESIDQVLAFDFNRA